MLVFLLVGGSSATPGRITTTTDPQTWLILGLGVVLLIYMAVLRPMMRRKKDPLEQRSSFSSLSQQRSVERQMQSLLVELSEMARQIGAQLDTRAAKLELLIREADEKIAALRAASNNGSRSQSADPPARLAGSASDDPPFAEPESDAPRHAEIYALADRGRDPFEIATQLARPLGEIELILALRSK
jgi:hypothetical protein